jgi:hypothetical protein
MPRESDIEQLYKDAIYIHLVQKGLSHFMAEFETNRMIQQKKEL